jgi:hypothetical protein
LAGAAAFFAVTFFAGAAALVATFFAEVAIFLLPGVVVGCEARNVHAPRPDSTSGATLRAALLCVIRGFSAGFVVLCVHDTLRRLPDAPNASRARRIMFDICIPILRTFSAWISACASSKP